MHQAPPRVCPASHMVLSCHVAMFVVTPCMWHIVLQCFQSQYLYLSSIPTHVWKASFFLCPCGCCTTNAEYVSEVEQVFLFSCLSWQCLQPLLVHFWLATSAWCCFLINFFCVVYHVLCMISPSTEWHLYVLPPVCLLWMCVLA